MYRPPATVVALIVITLGAGAAARSAQTPAKPAAGSTKAAAKLVWPAAVETAFKQKYPSASVKGVSKETEGGKTTYEVESIDAGKRRDLVYNPDGTVVSYEEELTAADVPAVVMAAIKTRYPKATITMYERLFTAKDNSANYEFGLKGAGVSEVVLTPEGKWVEPKLGK